jgi:hypothetical protein
LRRRYAADSMSSIVHDYKVAAGGPTLSLVHLVVFVDVY